MVMKILVLEVKKPRPIWEILFSTHHTDVVLLYIITSIAFLMMGLSLSQSELNYCYQGDRLIGANDFARFFTVHGTNMLLLWVIPFGLRQVTLENVAKNYHIKYFRIKAQICKFNIIEEWLHEKRRYCDHEWNRNYNHR